MSHEAEMITSQATRQFLIHCLRAFLAAKGATFFFTVVAYKRKRILCRGVNAALIKEAFQLDNSKNV